MNNYIIHYLNDTKNRLHLVIRTFLAAVMILSSSFVQAVITSADYDSLPPSLANSSSNADPLVMLVMSNDHQLFVKAYTDYDDLDGDGNIEAEELTYLNSYDYYGYFNSAMCYEYSSGTKVFTPMVAAVNHQCADAYWSGNFLNWATMTRMDILRKVLYGGKRSTDNANTVLERAYIPKDGHAFVKTFTAADYDALKKYVGSNTVTTGNQISMCNVTYTTTGSSETIDTSSNPPLLRIATGLYPGWGTNNLVQCEYGNEGVGGGGFSAEPPSNVPFASGGDSFGDLAVRVKVCVNNLEEDNCKLYPQNANSYKPTGLIQNFGERDNNAIKFGLMTGSYKRNLSGGVLRKDISKLYSNTDSSLDEINPNNGVFINQSASDKGIINTLNRLRISKFNTSTNRYSDCNLPGILNITEGSATSGCSNWGNPISEIYLEALRYFSGQTTPTAAFNANDASNIPSLPQINTWTDPLSASNACATCNIVVISTGINSFDTDQMSTASHLAGMTGATDVNTATNTVGNATNENINGNTYITGQGTGVTLTDKQCTGKTVTNFSDAKGVCAEAPTTEGGYLIAGLAHHAKKTDLRSGLSGKQNVNTYSISLGESIPSFSIPVGTGTVTIVPHCEANSNYAATAASTDWRACSMLDMKIESIAADLSTGDILIHWEDSTWGYDYDLDGVERIEWCVGSACTPAVASNQIKFTTNVELASAGHALLFGYTVSGTSDDGVKRLVLRPGPGSNDFNQLYIPTSNPGNQPAANNTTFTTGTSTAGQFKNPLWYAAKYGSFNDSNANDIPDVTSEWDSKINADGSFGSDGIPDNFFKVTNPAELETQLESAFNDILGRVSAGTSVSVLSTNNTGGGALYQALYDPVEQVNSQTVTWGGRLHGLFVDSSGFLREDSNTGGGTLGKLDGYTQDNIVILYYDDVDKETKLCRYTNPATSITNYATDCDSIAPLDDLNTIWNARDTLANLDASTITLQRPYADEISSDANKGRHIFTWVDTNTDGVIDNTEVVDFTAANFDTNSFGFLNVTTEAEADNIVEFIRGKEGITGYRSRTIDYDLDGTDEVWRLGDIIHSTPAVVGAPDANYGILYGDDTYSTFANKYLNRRQMIYVGANDGMLHAFNAGFYDENDKQFDLTVDLDDGSPAVSHPLGAEMWAYVPFNLLPHLKWLTETSYPHVYYVDGAPREFEVNIFPDDTDHPGGWGTILVVGMRLGGGDLSYDHDNNAGTANITTRSAYIVLDVTNPEVAPTLLAEISDPSLGFTTSTPSLVVDRTPGAGNDWSYGNTTTNNWYLAFGSGPNVLDTVTSTQNAKLYLYNLNTKTFKAGLAPQDLGIANSFVGDPTTVNWGSDFVDDVAYFGVVGGTESAPDGRLMRLVLSSDVTNTLLNTSQPFVSAPSAAIDETGRQWVYASSGRLYTGNDEGSTTQQTSYGIKEPQTAGVETYTTTITTASMQNVTGVQVYADSSVVDASPALLPAGTDTFSELVAVVQAQNGWYTNFTYDGTNPSERNFTPSIQWRGLTLFTTYTPPASDSCSEGRSSLHALYYRTGTAYPNAGLGNHTSITNADGSPLTVTDIDLGTGTASQVTILPGSGGSSGSGSATVQMGTSAISGSNVTGIGTTGGRKSWRELDF